MLLFPDGIYLRVCVPQKSLHFVSLITFIIRKIVYGMKSIKFIWHSFKRLDYFKA